MSVVETIKPTAIEFSTEIVEWKLELYSTVILRQSKNCTLTEDQCKKNLLLSNMHEEVAVSSEGKNKPETANFNNKI